MPCCEKLRSSFMLRKDLETINLDDFRHNFANLTGFRLVSRDDRRVDDILQQMAASQTHSGFRVLNSTRPRIIKVGDAVCHCCFLVLVPAPLVLLLLLLLLLMMMMMMMMTMITVVVVVITQ